MILKSRLPEVCEHARAAQRVLDVGGWFQPLNLATHVLDFEPYETRRRQEALDPENLERFSADTWVRHDACVTPWPFPDNYFDFSFCSHLLEDVRDPIAICRELSRVARAGYVETPSRVREIYTKQRFARIRMVSGAAPEVGFPHHRWFVEVVDGGLVFTAKTASLLASRDHYLTRGDVGRKLTEEESGLGLFWTEQLDAVEDILINGADLPAFKRKALSELNSAKP